jgi:pantothenate kinase
MPTTRWTELVEAAAALAIPSERHILGITGAPGAGKSVLAEALVRELRARGASVGLAAMDGFHLAQVELTRLQRVERKGAPDTFDANGYLNLLHRLRARSEPIVYAPLFDRSLEEPVGSAVPIDREVSLVITEGNYLLSTDPPWAEVRAVLDECWYVEVDEQLRLDRLVERHMQFGRCRDQARERAPA